MNRIYIGYAPGQPPGRIVYCKSEMMEAHIWKEITYTLGRNCEKVEYMVKIKPLVISLAISLGVGGLSALLTKDAMKEFAALEQPPLSPPGWVFPVVWTVLFILMGVAAYLVWIENSPDRNGAMWLYGVQLAFNFLWTIIFFNTERRGFALIWLVILWGLILATILRFRKESKTAWKLLIPYILWVTFAGYLNAGVWYLNR